ncbi:hypothetical protein PHYSODRAFT_522896 [Phytophthora sojae]|uniref:Uncharacterized protein n=1 Tax=Phytophthora sojae (strain P6497) TaxID=1094619 RepID=G5A315_PHYSP|nr:hypothetical protein PHYSODRAFT_522896 [Phytophthora sojae]EGZ10055.1 hypothetical protein PHYSODRAFT_522896 [Phytophthora sojae]|eukprot:XP_009534916.1 hypothetical protein PHYSODRAFT_522896 [Phytophthora sojae]
MNQEDVEVFSKETFLTSIKRISESGAGNRNAQNSNTIVIEEAPAMALVREKHAQLHDVVGSLSEKISAVLARQERDFLAAYRAHMYNVQKELHEMREKIHRNETYMKENLEAIEEDRNWLEKQLKACKKQNKLLRAELDVRLAVPGNNSGSDSGGVFPPFDTQSRSGSKMQKHRSSQDPISAAAPTVGAHGLPHLNLDVASTGQAAMLAEEREEKLKKQIHALKRELQHKSNELTTIKRQQRLLRRDGGTGQSLLERFFLQCVDSVKEEVAPGDKPRQPRFDVELDDFTPNDRVRLIERLLAHDEVLTFLYNHLFPSEKASAVNMDRLEISWSSQPSGRGAQRDEIPFPVLQASASLPDTSIRSGSLSLDLFTKEYLKSV